MLVESPEENVCINTIYYRVFACVWYLNMRMWDSESYGKANRVMTCNAGIYYYPV